MSYIPAAATLATDREQPDIAEEILSESSTNSDTISVTTGYGREGLSYDLNLKLDNPNQEPSVLEAVLNGEKQIDELSERDVARMGLELDEIITAQNGIQHAIENGMGGLDRSDLYRLNTALTNLHQIPPVLAHQMRLWTLSESRTTGAGAIQSMVADNYARLQNDGGVVDLSDKVRGPQAREDDTPSIANKILGMTGLEEGPKRPEFANLEDGPQAPIMAMKTPAFS